MGFSASGETGNGVIISAGVAEAAPSTGEKPLSAAASIKLTAAARLILGIPLSEAVALQFSGEADLLVEAPVRMSAAGVMQFSGNVELTTVAWRPIALEHEDNVFNKVGINLPDGLAQIKNKEIHSAPFDEVLGAYLVG